MGEPRVLPKLTAEELALIRFWAQLSGLSRGNALDQFNYTLTPAERAARIALARKEL